MGPYSLRIRVCPTRSKDGIEYSSEGSGFLGTGYKRGYNSTYRGSFTQLTHLNNSTYNCSSEAHLAGKKTSHEFFGPYLNMMFW